MITISKLNLRLQHQWLFHNLDLTFPINKWTTILGPSGVGKTTILRFIADLINADDVTISGSINHANNLPLSSHVSYMAQQDLLFPWLTVLENTIIGHKLRKTKNLESLLEKALALLKQVGLEKAANLLPEQLSGGMRQRAALVRTLIEDRPIVLMDEPFSALDTPSRIKIQSMAAKLLQDRTVIMVTHDPLEALRLSDKIYIMQGEPINLSAFPVPNEVKPRDPASVAVLALQARLFEQLTQCEAEA